MHSTTYYVVVVCCCGGGGFSNSVCLFFSTRNLVPNWRGMWGGGLWSVCVCGGGGVKFNRACS